MSRNRNTIVKVAANQPSPISPLEVGIPEKYDTQKNVHNATPRPSRTTIIKKTDGTINNILNPTPPSGPQPSSTRQSMLHKNDAKNVKMIPEKKSIVYEDEYQSVNENSNKIDNATSNDPNYSNLVKSIAIQFTKNIFSIVVTKIESLQTK